MPSDPYITNSWHAAAVFATVMWMMAASFIMRMWRYDVIEFVFLILVSLGPIFFLSVFLGLGHVVTGPVAAVMSAVWFCRQWKNVGMRR